MTPLLTCQDLTKSFGPRELFKQLSFSIFPHNRIGLMGPNGAGKSTLLKILFGIENPDSGILSKKRGLRIGYVPQSCEFADLSPQDILMQALEKDERHDYEKETLVQTWLEKLKFTETHSLASRLSGGWKKRLSLAQQLILQPDLLLLDEPTNHLDIEGIVWLEKFLAKEAPSYLLVSHDRYFLQNMVSRIIEINPVYPHGLLSIDGSYSFFLEKKEAFLKGQLEQERSLASKARTEIDWLRRSPKARTTKSQARVDKAHELLENLSQVEGRNRQKKASIDFAATERETRKLLTAKNLSKSLGGRLLFEHLDFILSPGTRIGLMGPNGSGKTTLLRMLADEISPDMGTIKKADKLQVVYFDQHRMQLPLHITLREALSPEGDFVTFRGQKIHVNGWCKRFLFAPDILDMPLAKLSGGERARISIAHLMLQSADILLLDEPTNDLDIPTLETLEESLLEFPGAVVLITHDRCMIDRICNSQILLGHAEIAAAPPPEIKKTKPKTALTYDEKKEYEKIERKIESLEAEIKALNHQLESPENAHNVAQLDALCTQISLVEGRIEQLYLRWHELDQKSEASKGSANAKNDSGSEN